MEDIMNINDLEKAELIDLTAMLGARLAKSVEAELTLVIRVKGLERALDAANRGVVKEFNEELGAWRDRAKQLSMEAQGWEESAKQTEALLREARSDLANAKEEWKASAEIFRANEMRLERELRGARATVMNEVSAMIPKAVEAERKACAEIARNVALTQADVMMSELAIDIVNRIKAGR
jgi:uncharacterized protein YhaN